MRLSELEHIIRASFDIVDDDIVVIGSAAILGSEPSAPPEMLTSNEADVYPLRDPARAIDIDAAIGEMTRFHDSFGYYAHGVGPETAMAPPGWQDRLIALSSTNTGGGTGLCMEPRDLVLSKLAAYREKDLEYAASAIRAGFVELHELIALSANCPDHVGRWLRSLEP